MPANASGPPASATPPPAAAAAPGAQPRRPCLARPSAAHVKGMVVQQSIRQCSGRCQQSDDGWPCQSALSSQHASPPAAASRQRRPSARVPAWHAAAAAPPAPLVQLLMPGAVAGSSAVRWRGKCRVQGDGPSNVGCVWGAARRGALRRATVPRCSTPCREDAGRGGPGAGAGTSGAAAPALMEVRERRGMSAPTATPPACSGQCERHGLGRAAGRARLYRVKRMKGRRSGEETG